MRTIIEIFLSKKIQTRCAAIVLCLSVCSLCYFITIKYKTLFFNSDSAIKVLLAKEIFESNDYFPKDWFYLNGDIFIIFGHAYIIPFLKYLPAGYLVHSISGVISAGLIILSFNLVLSSFNINVLTKIIVNTVVIGGISLPITEHIYGQVSYGVSFYITCFILWSVWKILRNEGNYAHIIFVALLIGGIYWSNPKRALVTNGLPLFISILLLNLKENTYKNEAKFNYRIYVILAVSAITGILANTYTLTRINMNAGYTALVWLNISEIIERISKIVGGIFFLLGGEPLKGREINSFAGIYEGIRIITAILFLYLAPSCIRNIYASKNQAKIFIANYTISSLMITSFFLIFTNLYDERYLIVSLLLYILLFFSDDENYKKIKIKYKIIKSMVIIGICSNLLVINTNYWRSYDIITARRVNYPLYGNVNELKNFLVENEVEYGYATYWRGPLITVLSDGKLKVRQIGFKNGLPIPDYYLSSKAWYSCSKYQGKVFMILTPEEFFMVNSKSIEEYGLKKVKELQFHDYKIIIYDKNLCNLPGWPG